MAEMTLQEAKLSLLKEQTPKLEQTPWSAIADAGNQEFIIDAILPAGQSTLLYGPTGAGKSLIALHMAISICEGTDTFNRFKTQQGTVMYLDYELGYATLKARLKAFGYPPDTLDWFQDRLFLYQHPDAIIDQPSNIIIELDHHQPDLLIIDSLGLALGGEENSPEAMKEYGRTLGNYCKRKGIAVLMIDNSGKDETRGPRGTSRKTQEAELVWRLKTKGDSYALVYDKDRFGESPPAISFTKHVTPQLRFISKIPGGLSTDAQKMVDLWKIDGFQPLSTRHARDNGYQGGENPMQDGINHLKTHGWWIAE